MREDRDLRQRVDNGFTKIDTRFAEIDTRFAEIDTRFAEMRGKFDATAAGQQQIVNLLNTFIAQQGEHHNAQ